MINWRDNGPWEKGWNYAVQKMHPAGIGAKRRGSDADKVAYAFIVMAFRHLIAAGVPPEDAFAFCLDDIAHEARTKPRELLMAIIEKGAAAEKAETIGL